MFNFLSKLLRGMKNGGFSLLLLTGFLFLIWGTFAPVGTIVWWLDRGAERLNIRTRELTRRVNSGKNDPNESSPVHSCYIVFLPGVGATENDLSDGENAFLDRLQQDQPQCLTVRSVFPYSAANQNIGGQQVFEFLWKFTERAEGWLELTKYILEARNAWRMAVSADNRYGLIYNQAIALTIVEQMEKKQPIPPSPDQPIQLILMGTSGGVQLALGAAPYIHKWLPVEITVVSFGGVFDGNEGFDVAQKIYHFRGERDLMEKVGGILFPSRWQWTIGSPYNRARREGRYIVKSSGNHEHEGDEGYFGQEPATNDGTTHTDLTLKQVNKLPIWSD